MKKHEWITGNHMKFESSHKTFNKKVDLITTGNALTNVQASGYVRAYTDEGEGLVDYPANKRPHGVLQEFDLNSFVKSLPEYVKDYIRSQAKDKGVIAYSFFYWVGDKKHIIGHVVTTENHKLLRAFYQPNQKSRDALDEAIKYITESEEESEPALSKSNLPLTQIKVHKLGSKGSGWHKEPISHSYATKFGKAPKHVRGR